MYFHMEVIIQYIRFTIGTVMPRMQIAQLSFCVRNAEHRNNINKKISNPSVITEHRLEYAHNFNWENVNILDKERYFGKKLVSEMLHINSQEYSLNLTSDTEFLHYAYVNIVNKM